MICLNNYTLVKDLISPEPSATTQNLVIGTLANNTTYWIYVYKEEVGKLKRIQATTNGSGLLTINLASFPNRFIRPYAVYYLWVTDVNSNVESREDITINTVDYQCFKMEFIRVQSYNSTDQQDYDVVTTTQTIEPII